MDLPNALELGKFGEDQRDSLAHPLVRVFGDPVVTNLHIADRHRQEQFAPPRFLLQCFQRRIDSSNSLIVPFMPSSKRSLG